MAAHAQVLEALWARFESQWYHDWLGLQAEKGAGMNMSKRCVELFRASHTGATLPFATVRHASMLRIRGAVHVVSSPLLSFVVSFARCHCCAFITVLEF